MLADKALADVLRACTRYMTGFLRVCEGQLLGLTSVMATVLAAKALAAARAIRPAYITRLGMQVY